MQREVEDTKPAMPHEQILKCQKNLQKYWADYLGPERTYLQTSETRLWAPCKVEKDVMKLIKFDTRDANIVERFSSP